MISFEIRGAMPQARVFLERLSIFACAESLGGVESLAEHPASMTHASIPPEIRGKIGISDGLVRLSVGLESEEDLWTDLETALAAAAGVRADGAASV
jgi:cystathionine gamma-synthase/cystathionine gamma-lyase